MGEKMPERYRGPVVEVTAPLERIWPIPAGASGVMHFAFQDTTATVSEGDRKLGSITGCVGGGLEIEIISDDDRREVWYLDPRDTWKAVTEAVAKWKEQNDG